LNLDNIVVTDGAEPAEPIDLPCIPQEQVMDSKELIEFLADVQSNPGGANQQGDDVLRALSGFPASPEKPIMNNMTHDLANTVQVEIIEQPAANRLRFRYAVEGRGAGALLGQRSTGDNRTFPTIKIHGYKGPAVVVVSCIEHKPVPNSNGIYRTHPHKIVGKECQKGVCKKYVNTEDMTCEFRNMGIQCMRRLDTEASLKERESIKVDPFGAGFGHKKGAFDLNIVKLAFQVFLQPNGPNSNGPTIVVRHVPVSQNIMDRKTFGDLKIENWSDNTSPFTGGKKILLFTERVTRDDIEVHFSYCDPIDGKVQILKGNFSPNDVHHQFGIALTTPAFPHFNVTSRVEAQMYLHKKSDGITSIPVPFYFCPNEDQKKPIITATRSQTKRDRNAVKMENVVQEESTGRIAAPPQRFKSGGGSVMTIEPKKENDENEEPKMSDMILQADPAVLAATNTSMGPPLSNSMDEFQKLLQQSKSQVSSDGILAGVDVDAMAQEVEKMNDGDLMFNDLSKELSESMKISNHQNSRSKSFQRQNSGLETPEVSMEQSKINQNNLDLC